MCFDKTITFMPETIIGVRREETVHVLGDLRTTKPGADQPAHLLSLISAWVIHLLESIISRLAKSEMSISS